MTEVVSISCIQANAERQRLDDLIKRLINDLCDVRRQRNALAPISRLPPELLIDIFNYCCRAPELSQRAWIPRVTQICSEWRKLALSASSLWFAPDFSRAAAAEEMLRRSGASPLHVFTFYQAINEPLKQTLSLHSERIERLVVHGRPTDFENMVKLCTRPASVLRELRLHCEPPGNRLFRFGAIFAADLPSLVELSLERCQPESMLPFGNKNLRILHLCDLAVRMDHLHDMLRSAPQLRELSISNALRNPATVPYKPSPVHLAALCKLSIVKDTASRVNAFLQPLNCAFSDFVSEDAIHINLARLSDHVTTQEHMSAIAAWISSSLATPLTGIFLDGAHDIHGFAGGRLPRNPNRLSSSIRFSLELGHSPAAPLVGVLVAAFLRGLPWMSITLLGSRIESCMALPDGGWRDVFRRADHVETLHVVSASSMAITSALCKPGEDGSVVLPRLQKVIVDDMRGRPRELGQWWQGLRDRLSLAVLGPSVITFCLGDPYRKGDEGRFPAGFQTIMQADTRIRVLWYGREVDLGDHS